MTNDKNYRIGCQSWGYEDWITKPGGDTVFYPRGTKQAGMLPLYAQIFDTIEIDASAYGTPQMAAVESWKAKSPDDFVFSFKVPRLVTHEFSLDARSLPVMNEFVSAVTQLEDKLGPILIQLPASFESTKEHAKNLREFLSSLPRDVRFAVEFRNPGWFVDWTYEELNANGAALALVAGKWVPEETLFAAAGKTLADFSYVRFMGIRDLEKFDRIYRDRTDELSRWKEIIVNVAAKDVYIYMDNYFEGHAPATANKFKEMLGLNVNRPTELEDQGSLF